MPSVLRLPDGDGPNLDPRIGVLNSGKFYAFAHGYDKPETVGTLEEVEVALGLRQVMPVHSAGQAKARTLHQYTVTLRFEYPSWDERDGIMYEEIYGYSKSDAIKTVRKRAEHDGHTGRYWFTASINAK